MGSLPCPLCCGRLFQDIQALKHRLLTWQNNLSCPVCLQKFYTTTEFAHHLDDESCKKVIPRPTPGPSSTVSTSPEETNQINVTSVNRIPYETIINVGKNTEEDVEIMGCEEDEDNLFEQWEQDEKNTQFQHFCESCNCTIQGVREHINDFHRDDMVVLKMEEGDGGGSVIEDVNQDLNSISSTEENTEEKFIVRDINTLKEREHHSKIVDNTPKALHHNESKKMQTVKNENVDSKVLDPHCLSKSKPKLDKVTRNTSKKESHSNEQKESKKLITSNEISYVRTIVHIEKFWEKQFWEKQAQKALLSVEEKKSRNRLKKEIIEARSCDKENPKQLCDAPNEQEGVTVAESTLVTEANADSKSKKPRRKKKPSGPTTCEVCNIKFRSNRSLLTHIKSHDPNTKKAKLFRKQFQKLLTEPAVCDICDTEFTTHRNLKNHMKMHLPEHSRKESQNLICDVCHMVCSTEQGLRVHNQIHTRDKLTVLNVDNQCSVMTPPVPLLKCKLCNVAFFSNEELRAHWQSHNQEEGEEHTTLVVLEETVVDECLDNEGEFFSCGKCGKWVACLLKEDHEKMHLVESRFGCSICNKQFPCETDLSFHVTIHKSETKYECHGCKLKFWNADLLKGHMKKIHSGVKRRFPCGFCGRHFAKPFEKVAHERIHTGEKPFECGVCGMRFRVKSCLRLHDRIHTGVRPYSCDQCGKRFRALSNYNHHIRLHSDVRSFACPICPKAFKTSVALGAHRAIHFKRFACPKCGRRFAAMSAMRAHLNSHSSNINLKHKCHICGATYIRKYALRDHIMTHGENPIAPSEEETSNCNYSEEVIS